MAGSADQLGRVPRTRPESLPPSQAHAGSWPSIKLTPGAETVPYVKCALCDGSGRRLTGGSSGARHPRACCAAKGHPASTMHSLDAGVHLVRGRKRS